ncbi:hypothetical protein LY76DRAFT_211121 [Colletotrichum caudatum]|nr:hypothetical protein LY76DRAFT_211121 [Colletotrichum caudatum]
MMGGRQTDRRTDGQKDRQTDRQGQVARGLGTTIKPAARGMMYRGQSVYSKGEGKEKKEKKTLVYSIQANLTNTANPRRVGRVCRSFLVCPLYLLPSYFLERTTSRTKKKKKKKKKELLFPLSMEGAVRRR